MPQHWSALRTFFRRLSTEPLHRTGVRALQCGVALVILFRLFTEWPFAAYLWGPQGVGTDLSVELGPFGIPVQALFMQSWGVHLVLLLMLVAAVLLLLGRVTRWATLLALVTYWLIGMRNESLGDGGDNVIRILLFYMVLFLPADAPNPEGVRTRTWLHNVGIVAVILQVIVVYAVAGLSKVMGELWTNGTAMYYIAQVDWFTTPYFKELFKNVWLAPLAAYATLAYQLSFPFLALSRYRLPLFAVGIGFHLGIAVMMGLITFSAIMITLELFLIPDRDYARMHRALLRSRAWLLQRFSKVRGVQA
ncbi:hypothetical protein F8S09_16665 [Deinococcus sp. SDU3-2]|uniref:HTTM-like domain-containing protein n=1 Tax=Deinococcus terrestris TaxID=2651870 RepID=A0A7X1TSY6_9DEIO|nr:HTTM domain-containing protein [Deinococcus terrestris]MPY68290.1 hypothetical protein [Deinococcus terrestris]